VIKPDLIKLSAVSTFWLAFFLLLPVRFLFFVGVDFCGVVELALFVLDLEAKFYY